MKKRQVLRVTASDLPEVTQRNKAISIGLCILGCALTAYSAYFFKSTSDIISKVDAAVYLSSQAADNMSRLNSAYTRPLVSVSENVTKVESLLSEASTAATLLPMRSLKDYTSFMVTAWKSVKSNFDISHEAIRANEQLRTRLNFYSPVIQKSFSNFSIVRGQLGSGPAVASFGESISRLAIYSESDFGIGAAARIDYDVRNALHQLKIIVDGNPRNDLVAMYKELGLLYQEIPALAAQARARNISSTDINNTFSAVTEAKNRFLGAQLEIKNGLYVSGLCLLGSVLLTMGGVIGLSMTINSAVHQLNDRVIKSISKFDQIDFSLRDLSSILKSTASGDLTVMPDASNEDTEEVADLITQFIIRVKNSITRIRNSMRSVDGEIREVKVENEKLVDTAARQLKIIHEARNGVDESIEMMRSISVDTEASAHAASSTLSSVQEGMLAVQESVTRMSGIRESIQETAKHIKQLGERSQEISEITDILSNFAEQVNVLSLNASIEASRAGDRGKGFRIIAEEIGALTGRFEDALQKVSKLIDAIQSDTRGAISSMEFSTNNVVDGSNVTEVARASLHVIKSVTETLDSMMNEISKNSRTQIENTEKLSSFISSVMAYNKDIVELVGSFERKVLSVKTTTDQIGSLSADFKI